MNWRRGLMFFAAAGGVLGAVWLILGPEAASPHRPMAMLGLALLGLGLCKEARRRDTDSPDKPG